MKMLTRSRALILILGGLILVGCAARQGDAVDSATVSGKPRGKPNRLALETSPYLLMHAHNPVEWYPWGPEAFAKAKKEGKLIFLSVGYSSCYWCHVMERKVFMNAAIAKTLNENFVCIKVDREERPDVDDVYMTALQVYYQMIGSPSGGGWPLSMFVTPDGKPVAGGTYFPPEDTDGATGFPSVLERLIDLWKDKKDQMEGNAEIIANETRRVMRPKMALKPVEVNAALVQKSFEAVVASIDPEFGGVDFNPQRAKGPKFPTPAKLLFIQDQLNRQKNDDAAQLLDLTLMQMACGGIRDHVGGGFHRYSVDRQWRVPHFEKMLYDQAQLTDLYASAYAATGNVLYKQVTEEILQFVARELTSSDGGFYSALDAETNEIEGEFYVWEARDLDKILGPNAAAFKEAYHVKDLSDFEHGNVLRLSPKQLPGPARDISLGGGKSQKDEFSTARQKLLEVRNQRPKLMRDEKILVGWNGLMIGACARAGMKLEQPDYIRTAEKAATFVMTNMRDQQGRLLHAHTAGQSRLNAYLDDYAFVIDGLLALHDATKEGKWLRAARLLQDDQLKMFRDETGGAFFFTSHEHEELLARTKNCYDGVLPAGNSVSARNLLKLAKLTNEQKYNAEARTIIELFASTMEQSPRSMTVLAQAAAELLAAETPDGQSAISPNKDVIQAGVKNGQDASAPLIQAGTQKEDPPKKDEHVRGVAYLSVDKLPAGSACQVIVVLTVAKGWHINANPPSPDYLKPTKISWKSKNGVELVDVKYPKGFAFKIEDSDDEAMVYEGEVQVRGTLKVPKDAGGLTEDMEITVHYQACNEKGCLPPKSIKLTGRLQIANQGEVVKSINGKLFNPKIDSSR
ncbi:MAG: DUF255 domain-containing protein [Planctomycetes bacterium]|nr:DUF255 domain-containing protein [Planctomycetota bacterium]